MPYLATFTYQVNYDAHNDDQARLILDHIEDSLAYTTLPHQAQFADAPDVALSFFDNRGPLRTVFDNNHLLERHAPLAEGNVPVTVSGTPCTVCAEHDDEYARPEPEPVQPAQPNSTTFYGFCSVCCGDFTGTVTIGSADPIDASLMLIAQLRRQAREDLEEFPDPDAAPFELRSMTPGEVETDTSWYATADKIPPCGRCGQSVTAHQPTTAHMTTCRFNHPARQSAPEV